MKSYRVQSVQRKFYDRVGTIPQHSTYERKANTVNIHAALDTHFIIKKIYHLLGLSEVVTRVMIPDV